MDKDENIPSHEKRRQQVYADDEDVLVEVLGIAQADYECVMVNSSWPEKSLLEGDIILFAYTYRSEPRGGDIVLIEQDGHTRLGILATPGELETINGPRPLDESERIVGVGVALARKLKDKEKD
jgi:hypothetical protein